MIEPAGPGPRLLACGMLPVQRGRGSSYSALRTVRRWATSERLLLPAWLAPAPGCSRVGMLPVHQGLARVGYPALRAVRRWATSERPLLSAWLGSRSARALRRERHVRVAQGRRKLGKSQREPRIPTVNC